MFFDVLIYFSGYKVYNESADYITVCKYSLYDSLLWIKQTEGVEAKFTDHLTTNKQTIRAYNLLKYLKKKKKKKSHLLTSRTLCSSLIMKSRSLWM